MAGSASTGVLNYITSIFEQGQGPKGIQTTGILEITYPLNAPPVTLLNNVPLNQVQNIQIQNTVGLAPLTSQGQQESSSPSPSATQTPSQTSAGVLPSLSSSNTNASSSPQGTSPSPSLATPTSDSSSNSVSGGAASSTASSSPAPASSNTGLIAGIAVLGGLLAIALIVIAFLLFRRRRQQYARAAASDRDLAYDPTGIALKDKVASLHHDRDSRDVTASPAPGGMLASGRGGAGGPLDDKTIHGHFAKLNKDIADWVLTYFKNSRQAPSPPRELTSALIKTQPNHSFLMQESRTRYLLLRAIAADILADAMNSGQLFGNDDYARKKESMARTADAAQLASWRSTNMNTYSNDSGAQDRAIEAVAQRIDYSTSALVVSSASEARLQHIRRIVQSAAALSGDLERQRASFVFERPQSSLFDAATMEDVLQERRSEDLRGHGIQSVVFPAVFRYGDNEGVEDYSKRTVISKAAVLL